MSFRFPLLSRISARAQGTLVVVSLLLWAPASPAGPPSQSPETWESDKPTVIVPNPQIELAAYLLTLAADAPPRLGTPAWAQAYADVTGVEDNPAVVQTRELLSNSVSEATIYRFALLHSPPPDFQAEFRDLPAERLPDDVQRLLDQRSVARRLTEGMRDLYRDGTIDYVLRRYAKARQSMVKALETALPAEAPFDALSQFTGMTPEPGTLFLVPSLLAQKPVHFSLPAGPGATARFSVLPMDERGIPDQKTATLIRYEEAAYWMIEPALQRYRMEVQEVSRSRQDVPSQLTRAVVLHQILAHRLSLADLARTRYQDPDARLLPTFESGLDQWEAVRHRFPTFDRYLPELLDRALVSLQDDVQLPQLKDPSFESWDGVVPREWSLEVIEPATTSPRPSRVLRVRGARRNSSALRLAGDADTNQWRGVVSRPMPVSAGDRITIQARMRARNIAPQGSRIRAAHLEARVYGRDKGLLRRVVGREFLGTTGWETVSFEFVVPATAVSMQLACILTMTGELTFDDIVMSVERPSLRHFIRNGGFEAGGVDAPADWEVVVTSIQTQVGPSVRSRWNLDDDHPYEGRLSLHLAGDDRTSRWLEVRSASLSVVPGQKLMVSAHVRSRNVTLGPRQHRHANLVITFLNEQGLEVSSLETPLLEGTVAEWQLVKLEVLVPFEAVAVRIGCLLTMSGELWVDNVHVSRR